jgi:hypothetical protein
MPWLGMSTNVLRPAKVPHGGQRWRLNRAYRRGTKLKVILSSSQQKCRSD